MDEHLTVVSTGILGVAQCQGIGMGICDWGRVKFRAGSDLGWGLFWGGSELGRVCSGAGSVLGRGLFWGGVCSGWGLFWGGVVSGAGLNWAGSSLGRDLIKARVKPMDQSWGWGLTGGGRG